MVYAVAMFVVPGGCFRIATSSATEPPLNSELGRFMVSSEMYGGVVRMAERMTWSVVRLRAMSTKRVTFYFFIWFNGQRFYATQPFIITRFCGHTRRNRFVGTYFWMSVVELCIAFIFLAQFSTSFNLKCRYTYLLFASSTFCVKPKAKKLFFKETICIMNVSVNVAWIV